ncbi:hypothetical protein E4U34_005213 [Claviceps purpurea]|nr:hypothetical protein E4U34_005213 [Claviceps purpurea]
MSVLTPWMEPAATGLSSLNNADPLSPLETTTLRDYVNRFVRGLYDKSVMQEAIGQSVLISDSLRSAFEIVQRAGSIQGVKTDTYCSSGCTGCEDNADGGLHSAAERLPRQ